MKLKDLMEKYGEYDVGLVETPKGQESEWARVQLFKPKPKTVWDLKIGVDNYYYVDESGDVGISTWYDWDCDRERFNIGSAFLTEEEAEKDVERRKVETLLLRFGGRRWYRTNGYNYCIWVNSWDSLVVSSTGRVQDTIYFDTEEQAQNAVKEIGEERLKKALFEVR